MSDTSIAVDSAVRVSLRVLARAVLLLGHVALAFVLSSWLQHRYGPRWHQCLTGKRVKMWWTRRLGEIIGLRIHTRGRIVGSPVLLAANHVSWLDIVAIAAVSPACFVAKSEVRAWPLIGRLAERCGTVFLVRVRASVLQEAVEAITRELNLGNAIVVFPEGTSTDGTDVKCFRPALFEAAVASHSRIQPLALCYERDGVRDNIAPFIGEDDLVRHLLRIIKARASNVHLHFLPPVDCENAARAQLANAACARVRTAVLAPPARIGSRDAAISEQPAYSASTID